MKKTEIQSLIEIKFYLQINSIKMNKDFIIVYLNHLYENMKIFKAKKISN